MALLRKSRVPRRSTNTKWIEKRVYEIVVSQSPSWSAQRSAAWNKTGYFLDRRNDSNEDGGRGQRRGRKIYPVCSPLFTLTLPPPSRQSIMLKSFSYVEYSRLLLIWKESGMDVGDKGTVDELCAVGVSAGPPPALNAAIQMDGPKPNENTHRPNPKLLMN